MYSQARTPAKRKKILRTYNVSKYELRRKGSATRRTEPVKTPAKKTSYAGIKNPQILKAVKLHTKQKAELEKQKAKQRQQEQVRVTFGRIPEKNAYSEIVSREQADMIKAIYERQKTKALINEILMKNIRIPSSTETAVQKYTRIKKERDKKEAIEKLNKARQKAGMKSLSEKEIQDYEKARKWTAELPLKVHEKTRYFQDRVRQLKGKVPIEEAYLYPMAIGSGIFLGGTQALSIITHPLETGEAIYEASKTPKKSLKEIGEYLQENPLTVTGELLAWYGIGKGISQLKGARNIKTKTPAHAETTGEKITRKTTARMRDIKKGEIESREIITPDSYEMEAIRKKTIATKPTKTPEAKAQKILEIKEENTPFYRLQNTRIKKISDYLRRKKETKGTTGSEITRIYNQEGKQIGTAHTTGINKESYTTLELNKIPYAIINKEKETIIIHLKRTGTGKLKYKKTEIIKKTEKPIIKSEDKLIRTKRSLDESGELQAKRIDTQVKRGDITGTNKGIITEGKYQTLRKDTSIARTGLTEKKKQFYGRKNGELIERSTKRELEAPYVKFSKTPQAIPRKIKVEINKYGGTKETITPSQLKGFTKQQQIQKLWQTTDFPKGKPKITSEMKQTIEELKSLGTGTKREEYLKTLLKWNKEDTTPITAEKLAKIKREMTVKEIPRGSGLTKEDIKRIIKKGEIESEKQAKKILKRSKAEEKLGIDSLRKSRIELEEAIKRKKIKEAMKGTGKYPYVESTTEARPTYKVQLPKYEELKSETAYFTDIAENLPKQEKPVLELPTSALSTIQEPITKQETENILKQEPISKTITRNELQPMTITETKTEPEIITETRPEIKEKIEPRLKTTTEITPYINIPFTEEEEIGETGIYFPFQGKKGIIPTREEQSTMWAYQPVYDKEHLGKYYEQMEEAIQSAMKKTDETPAKEFKIQKKLVYPTMISKGENYRKAYKFQRKRNVWTEKKQYQSDFDIRPYIFGS